ncbi:MAG: putative hydrolases of HD superfamily [Parcubacteria group bacterium Licking1014_1]|nr:MAG: putative hydrolases of HD superfamily [Parcubacteria group bacterium Licking1014_1]
MDNILNFFIEVGKLKRMPRRGWVLRNIKNPESIAEHTFRVALMAWILGKRKHNFNIEKVIKMALIHDICEVYAGDTTPYDSILPKSKKEIAKLMETWPRFSNSEKKRLSEKKYKKEKKALEKLLKNLPHSLEHEIKNLWLDYEKGLTKEGRFFKQADRLENFLQSLEYWKKYKKPPQKPWWNQARELFDDPVLLEFIETMDKKFHKKQKPRI